MSKVTIIPWTDELFDSREAEFAALVMAGVGNMTDTVLALLRKQEVTTAAAAPQDEPSPPAIPPQVEAAALSSWSVWVETELYPSVVDVFDEGAALVVDALLDVYGEDARDAIPPVGNEYADEYLQHARNRMVGVGENVWKGIRKELQAGLDAGEGIPQLAARLENYAQLSEGRANTVARTEVISSANAGSYLQMVEAGLDGVTKEWLATDDHRTRISHVHADDQAVELTAEFQVEVYAQGALQGTEPMEFPGDPIATPGNVINCRCSMSFSFDDEQEEGILTAAGKFVESEHPRDSKGKFMNKLEIDLLKAKDKAAFLDKLTTAQKAKIGKATKDAAGIGTKEKAATSGPPLGGLDKKTGKKAPAGKPVFLRVKTLFETDYEDGAIVAVRPSTNERVVWDAGTKRMQLQHLNKDGDWKLVQAFTRGALMKEAKDEEGWFTPSKENTTPADVPGIGPLLPELLPGQKPIKLRTQVVYSKKYADGETVAVHPEDGLEVVWDEQNKRMLVQRDGDTQESLTRGALMAKYKDADGWFSPGNGQTSEITPVINEPAPVPAPDITGVELSKNQFNTLEGFGKIDAVHTGTLAPVKGMYTSAYPTLEKLGLVERFQQEKNVPGQLEDWLRITDKGRAVLAAGPDGIVLAAPKKARKLYVEYNGVVHTRTTAADYKYASVVHFPWDGGKDVVYSWHATEALASKSTLTASQKKNGAYVKAVLEVSDKPITPSVVPAANVPDTPAEQAPTPADIPTIAKNSAIPSPDTLDNTGVVIGSHGATIYRDTLTGKKWLFKPSPIGMGTFMADADMATARLHELAGLPTPTTGKIVINGQSGSIQEMFAGATDPFGYNFKPQDLTPEDKLVIQKEHIFDWLVGNHDGHSRNYVRLPSGELVGIDKGQAFKFFSSDSLDPSFKPNPTMPAANLLMQAYANGEGGGALIYGVDHPEIKKLLAKLEGITDAEYREILRPYAVNAAKYQMLAKPGPKYLGATDPAFPANDVEAFLDFAVDRKSTLKEDFQVLYADLAKKRKAALAAKQDDSTPLAPFVSQVAADGEPVVMNSVTLTKTKYSHGEIVGENKKWNERVVWNDNTQKFEHQIGGPTWVTVESLSKTAAVKYFPKQLLNVWTKPVGTTHADMPAPLPHVAGLPPVDPSKLPAPLFTVAQLLSQSEYSALDYNREQKAFKSFVSGGSIPMDIHAKAEDMFLRLLEIQQEFATDDGMDISLLALLRMMDRVDHQFKPIGTKQNFRFENTVKSWLDTPDGMREAGILLRQFQNGPVTPKVETTTKQAVQKLAVQGKPSKAKLNSTEFAGMTDEEGRAFFVEIAGDLSSAQRTALQDYTSSDYQEINGAMRGKLPSGTAYTGTTRDFIRAGRIQQSMRPLKRHTRLYRGAGANTLGFTENYGDNPVTLEKLEAMLGKTFQDPGFTSTSVLQDKAFDYQVFRFTIEAPKGTPGVYVDSISQNKGEKEMLLAAGTKYKIVAVEKANVAAGTNRYNIVLRIVP